jgi:hypothetical protein
MSGARPLTRHERDALLLILAATSVSGSEELRGQVDETTVVGGDTFLDLEVSGNASRSSFPDGHVPIRAYVDDADGEPVGEVLVWVKDGYLSSLEHAWTTDEAPAVFPHADRIRLEAE